MESLLVRKCIEAATENAAAVEKWRRQRRTLERMPSHLAEALLRQLLRRRLLFPSLLEVFKLSIEEIDLRGENCVDAEWMAYLGAFRYLRSMILEDCHKINNAAIWSITGMTYLKELNLSRCSKITDAGVRHLVSIPTLEKLCISETGVTADGVKVLASLTNLLVLDLGGLPVTDSALISLQSLQKLQHLELWGSEVSNEGAIVLEMFPSLNTLNLGWTNVTDLPNLPSLVCLNMSNCMIHSLLKGEGGKPHMEKLILSGATVTTNDSNAFQCCETSRLVFLDLSNSNLQSFIFLLSMNTLTDLNLSGCVVDDNSVEHIARVGENLRYLSLSNTKITSDAIATLAGNVPKLETLLLSATCIDDTAIPYISIISSLKVLNLSKTNVKGMIRQESNALDSISSFSELQSLSHLRALDLEELHLNDAALYPLTNFGRLTYLSLQSVSLTDASLYHLSSATKLLRLSIRDAVLTDSGLCSFIPPPKLQVFDLSGCWLLSKDVLMHFCHKHPQIELKHELIERQNVQYSSPSQVTTKTSPYKHKQGKFLTSPMRSDENFLDQRLKYSREELLDMQMWSTMPSNQGTTKP